MPTVILVVAAVLVVVFVAVNFAAGERKVEKDIEHLYGAEDPQFLRSMGLLVGPSILEGNSVRALVNGDEIFPAMLEAIRGAQHSILFESYIYWSGDIGEEFAAALAERARAGVKVHVLVDWVGSARMEQRLEQQMRDAGVEVEKYHPLRWYNLGRLNNRTHRKLLIADGRIGFTGGVGIAQNWTGHAQDPEHWRDSHFRVEGPVVAQMQSVMLDNWVKTKGHVLHGPEYFPPLQPAGEQKAQMFSSSPSGGSESMLMMVLLAITAACKTIDLSSAYFVPEGIARRALVAAAKRGVRIRIVVPGKHIDAETVRRASRALWGELLEAGIEIHEYQPTMYHCKVMIVDGFMTSVGSTNFDVRSFRLNDEANLNVYDADFAARQARIFEEDLKQARRITLEEWKARPWREKLHERAFALLRIAL
ncbi:phospholipase D-like domain-containing protein [Ramlibacter albus]|uniref:Cardiolipin synthase B n=1 Tax=Ramlibacter albus TaxID=2079448 RepID=A0A923S5I0_9BURK|nr:phospholipase D-like domain-containing protein [Ramlibacter albus]MBC5768590.1 cardiolipin synthase B [Ramlibacter albus]